MAEHDTPAAPTPHKTNYVPWVAGGIVVAGAAWWYWRSRRIAVTSLQQVNAPVPLTLSATVVNKRAGATDMRVGDAILVTATPSTETGPLEFRTVATRPNGVAFTPCSWSVLKTCSCPLDMAGTWTMHVEARPAGTLGDAIVSSEQPFTVSTVNGQAQGPAANLPTSPTHAFFVDAAAPVNGSFAIPQMNLPDLGLR